MKQPLFTLVPSPPKSPPSEFFGFSSEQGLEFEDYASAYWDAATKLVDGVTEGSINEFPAVYLYRHAMEVSIKAILIAFAPDIVTKQTVVERSHRLEAQLHNLLALCCKEGYTLSPESQHMISTWKDSDPDSLPLKYPERKDKKKVPKDPVTFTRDVFLDGKTFDMRAFRTAADQTLTELRELFDELRRESDWEAYQEILRDEGINDSS